MSHTSLYRRFRPDTFDKMVRQEHVVRILKNQIGAGSVGHAYLFTGPRGTGKTSVARIFARAVNCEHPVNGSPCGKCPSCVAIAEGSLDVTEIDAASNNGVNEMRDLREKVQYPPVSGRYKVYIIDEVHMLTDSAFNALLKTLEEPPAHAIFILATTEPQKLPATILSRCMRLDFKLIPEEDLEAHLIRVLDEIGKPYEREAVAAIARAGAGSDRDMLSIAEMCIAYGDKLTYAGVTAVLGAADMHETCVLVEALLHAKSGEALAAVERMLAEGKAVGVLLKDLVELLNRLAVAKTCATAEKLLALPKEMFAEIKRIADGANGRAILRATEIFARAETELRYASSPRILLETAILRVAVPAAELELDALTVRVSELEREIARLKANGVPVQVAAPIASAPKKEERQASAPVPSAEPEYDYLFPEEEPIFAEAYFSDEPVPEQAPQVPKQAPKAPEYKPAPVEKPAFAEKPVSPEAPAPEGGEALTAQAAYGKFIRMLRKTSRNGVLFTMCSDLEAVFEGEKLVFLTDISAVERSLMREDNRKIIAETLAQVGVTDFEVRYKKAQKQETADGLEQLKRDFKDYPIEIK